MKPEPTWTGSNPLGPALVPNPGTAQATAASLRARCTRFLNGHGHRTTAEMLATIGPDTEMDRYGQGGVVQELETEVAALLGKEAALFLPSGTMAQQAILRIHADRRSRRNIVFHPACHLDVREGRAYERLHGLHGVPAGDPREPLSLGCLERVREPPAALLIELPQRDLGGVLPTWDALVAQVDWARAQGAAVHLDGARLWESTPFYGRTPGQVAALFDTVYVSFYKGLGGIAGCCAAGPADVLSELAEWRLRHGGQLFGLWPYAASALTVLRERLPRMPTYAEHARAIAARLEGLPGVRVLPNPPHTNMMHIRIAASASELRARAWQIAEQDGIWTFPDAYAVDSPLEQRIELWVGDATLGFRPDEVRDLILRLATADPIPTSRP